MSDHDITSIEFRPADAFNDRHYAAWCRCGEKFTGDTADLAREAHAHHHRAPDAREGIAAARAALENGRRPKENG